MRARRARALERGYAMAALLVAMSVIAIALSTALPVVSTTARREREAELAFRGEQYARAIGLFQRKYGNALPPNLDVLVTERFLRRKYKDPITGDDFQVLGPGSPQLAEALNALPQQAQEAQRGRGVGGRGVPQPSAAQPQQPSFRLFGTGEQQPSFRLGGARGMQTGRGAQTAAGRAGSAQAGGGILAVASKSTESSIRLYNGKGKYNEWVFMALQASTTAGAPPGSGAQTPGGRGGTAPGGRGGVPPSGGRSVTRGARGARGFP